MLLYYYTAKQWGMKSLWEKRLKVAQYSDLNDPFELYPFAEPDREARKHLKVVTRLLSADHGILCLSESWRTTLMWAHYADKHKGMCLGFEIEEGPHLAKIKYEEQRLQSPIDMSQPLNGITEEMLHNCLNIKHSGWAYEREHRLRVPLNNQRDGLYYHPFNDAMKLRQVIIGSRCTLSIVDVAEAVGDETIDIWTARAAHESFHMCTNKTKRRRMGGITL